jgi:hypothetical protein
MDTKNTNEFPIPSDSYVAFDAISLRNLIIKRLNDQGTFTDQQYIGSNLASVIDIISYSFNTLMYYLNRTSTESNFTEAQLYENINKIVKLLDYKPIGYQTSTLAFRCSADNTNLNFSNSIGTYTIPRYSYIMIGDSPFSFSEDIAFTISQTQAITSLDEVSNKKLLYQGVFRESPVYVATGSSNEMVTLNITDAQIDHFNADVYVYEQKQSKWFKYKVVPSLYTERSFSRTVEKRLNSNQLYEYTFGNGINGRNLDVGDRVVIYFLQSAGEIGVVGPGSMDTLGSVPVIYFTDLYEQIIADVNEQNNIPYIDNNQFAQIIFSNVAGSTIPQDVENVESIRKNAPNTFKSQYRLVTKSDFETFIATNCANFISDARIFSNWDYAEKYLKYFNDISVRPSGYKQILLNQVLYSDACNFNNIYVCAIPKISQGSTLKYLLPAQKEIIKTYIEPLKTLTTEINFLDPIYKAFDFGIKSAYGTVVVDDRNYSRLEIIKSKNSLKNSNSILIDVVSTFQQFFNLSNIKLGSQFNYVQLVDRLLSIDGVSGMQTRNEITNEIFQGLSFYNWNPVYPDLDKQCVTNNTSFDEFVLFYFEGLSTIDSKITII